MTIEDAIRHEAEAKAAAEILAKALAKRAAPAKLPAIPLQNACPKFCSPCPRTPEGMNGKIRRQKLAWTRHRLAAPG